MNIRTSKPTNGNKFYITKSNGGYSTCIQGNPKDSQCNVLANCVGYACGRFNEIIGSMQYPSLNCNAENFIERAKSLGLETHNVPTLGGIMVWQKGNTLNGNDGAGHVAIVERIDNANQIYTSESGYGSSAFWNSLRTNNNGRWGLGAGYIFRGCIVNPVVGYVTAPVTPNKPIDEIAREVMSGAWGNGEDRKNRLTQAGYNYTEIQNKVNEMSNNNIPTPSKSNEEIANEVIAGRWGNGQDRVNRLNNAGYNYDTIQSIVNNKCNTKSIDEIAREVIAGKWGNGKDRKNKLSQAGYNYTQVQNRVNELI